jgi:vacuolar-type H+-ATPase subunit F/Vma7
MAAPFFIGDEVSAAGFRLAGAVVRTPAAGEEASFLEWARRESPLVLITAEFAARIPHSVLARALAAQQPLVLVVPDVRGLAAAPDIAGELKRQLGMESGT